MQAEGPLEPGAAQPLGSYATACSVLMSCLRDVAYIPLPWICFVVLDFDGHCGGLIQTSHSHHLNKQQTIQKLQS